MAKDWLLFWWEVWAERFAACCDIDIEQTAGAITGLEDAVSDEVFVLDGAEEFHRADQDDLYVAL